MSLKRKLSEYHDPDYPQNSNNRPEKHPRLNDEERLDKICSIVRDEFQKELRQKEQEITEIDSRLQQTKRLLQRVRYAVVASYYSKKKLEYSENEMRQKDPNLRNETKDSFDLSQVHRTDTKKQNAIHPSLKRLLGKKPVDYDQILSIRPTRQAAQTARASITERLCKSKKDDKSTRIGTIKLSNEQTFDHSFNEEAKVLEIKKETGDRIFDRNKAPIERITSFRGGNQYRHLIVVGNTSKYLQDEKDLNGITHKWLIYVNTKNSEVSIRKIVSKVRFFLHPSYKPHDVIEVTSAPFQISRRGWGEFPVRVQLFFHDHIQQKPLQIFHNLKLDKKLTGLQTMGAETIVEVWLNLSNEINDELTNKISNNSNLDQQIVKDELKECETFKSINDGNIGEDMQSNCHFQNIENSKGISNVTLENSVKVKEEINTEMDVKLALENDVKDIVASYNQPLHEINKNSNNETLDNKYVSIKVEESLSSVKPSSQHLNKIGTNAFPILVQTSTVHTSTISTINNSLTSIKSSPTASTISNITVTPSTAIKSTNSPTTAKSGNVFKCLDSNGRVITVQLAIDPSNKKNIKIIKIPKTANENEASKNSPMTEICQPIVPIAVSVAQQANNTVPNKLITVSSATTPIQKTTNSVNIKGQQIFILPKNVSVQNNQMLNNTNLKIIQIKKPITGPVTNLQTPATVSAANIKISIPTSTGLSAITSPQNIKISTPSTTIQTQTINTQQNIQIAGKNVIMRNGQVLLVDADKMKQKSVKPKQESLLKINTQKPMSLLKSNFVQLQSNSVRSKDEQKNMKMLTNVPNMKSVIYNTLSDKKIMKIANSKYTVVSYAPDFMADLKKMFFNRHNFANVQLAVNLLLKNIPLYSQLAKVEEYRKCFPFTVESETIFNEFLLPKKLSIEWYRAKMINRLLGQHKDLQNFPIWTTKEIVQYSRQFGYTPPLNANSKSNDPYQSTQLVDLIKKEIKREHLKNDTISFSTRIDKWIEESSDVKLFQMERNESDEIINVDGEFDDDVKLKSTNKIETEATIMSSCVKMQFDPNLLQENYLITNICREIKIQFDLEEIVPGVMYASAQRLLIQTLHSFLEQLLRQAYASKSDAERLSALPIENEVRCDDIRKVISEIPEFDFLSNKHLGVIACKKEQNI